MLRVWENLKKQSMRAATATLVICAMSSSIMFADGEQFDKYEIRVIRPKYFSKAGRLELGSEMAIVMNQSFIYTFLATGLLDYHFTESLAAEGMVAYGYSLDRDDKKDLNANFKIKTQLRRTQYIGETGLLYTPIYGKYQLSNGRLIYMDTFISAGVGQTGINYLYDQCNPETTSNPPAPRTVGYMTFFMGLGQRIFLDKKLSLRWDVRGHYFGYNDADGSCDPSTPGAAKSQINVTMQLGAGYFL